MCNRDSSECYWCTGHGNHIVICESTQENSWIVNSNSIIIIGFIENCDSEDTRLEGSPPLNVATPLHLLLPYVTSHCEELSSWGRCFRVQGVLRSAN